MYIVPSHVQVLEWRTTVERLERFTNLCGTLVKQFLQRLVMKALSSLLFVMKRLVRLALEQTSSLDEKFGIMMERVASNPFTQGILDRQDITLEEDDLDHMGLLSLQASSFVSLLPSLETGQ